MSRWLPAKEYAMKKSILAIVFVVAIVLVGCSDFSHEHSWKETFRVEDTTTGEGEIVYVCIGCGEIVSKKAFLVKDEVELKNAIAVADASKPIYILDDISLTEAVRINGGKSIEINLNGKTVSGKTINSTSTGVGIKNSLFCIENANVVFTGAGTIQDTGKYYGGICAVGSSDENAEEYTVVTVNKGVVFKESMAIWVNKNSDGEYVNHGVIVNFHGTADLSDTEDYAFYVNGVNKAEKNAPVFNLDGARIVSKGQCIYAAGYAKWNIKDTTIEGVDSAIEIRAGELNIESGKYSASATPTAVAPNGNGTTSSGAAIAVAQHGTKLPISVNISGGVFEGYSALYESNPQGNDADSIAKVKLNVTGGSFNSTASDSKCAIHSEDCTGFIVGGTYNSDPTSYVAAGYKASESEGVWTVVSE